MAELFQTTVSYINIHLKNIFDERELDPKATIKDFLIVRLEGKREVNRNIDYYNSMPLFRLGIESNPMWQQNSGFGLHNISKNIL